MFVLDSFCEHIHQVGVSIFIIDFGGGDCGLHFWANEATTIESSAPNERMKARRFVYLFVYVCVCIQFHLVHFEPKPRNVLRSFEHHQHDYHFFRWAFWTQNATQHRFVSIKFMHTSEIGRCSIRLFTWSFNALMAYAAFMRYEHTNPSGSVSLPINSGKTIALCPHTHMHMHMHLHLHTRARAAYAKVILNFIHWRW